MSKPVPVTFHDTDLEEIATAKGRVAVVVTPDGRMDAGARRANRLTKGALKRMIEAGVMEDAKPGDVISLSWPTGMAAEALDIVCLPRTAKPDLLRKAGSALGKLKDHKSFLVLAGQVRRPEELALGLSLRAYDFTARKTAGDKDAGEVRMMVADSDAAEAAYGPAAAVAEGVFLTRDLVNEPANHLTTTEFATRIEGLRDLGVEVEILEEARLRELGMGALLAVGHGSESPSKVAVMHWRGGTKDAAPLALVGKGVVFDTGGISLKPAAGMEDMTMDMGGAGVVTGVMHALARRKAAANVVGLVGLVENMPSERATRPGDVITSMKGETVEVINTDAEGRLVLADVMWYAQEVCKPAALVDLATLTGAIIIGLGHEKAGVFSNDDKFCGTFLKAAEAEGEGAWRMPLGEAYDEMLKSRIADMKNVGGRPAGSITAAQFLARFVKRDMPWIHLDIAGVASVKSDTAHAPKGATGWGVMALNRLVSEQFETS
ncbi:leucyl aminopeptidase [Roseovarius sp. TE539]|uniref:leucyl aminopeptidase n=1 Tax=Roseovarius sp. TE539 TaxID=2249812 RepID=UPI000DDF5EC0|nr:leucyl aminopeptidase [Roseovarius sp. TE539]RBI71190.1 leucyl aminopeptidase [Roseovarius sp. TE539]